MDEHKFTLTMADSELIQTELVEREIETEGTHPIKHTIRPVPLPLREEMRNH